MVNELLFDSPSTPKFIATTLPYRRRRKNEVSNSTLLKAIAIINQRNSNHTNLINSLQLIPASRIQDLPPPPKHNNDKTNYTIPFSEFSGKNKKAETKFECLICYETFCNNTTKSFQCSKIVDTKVALETHKICEACLKSYAHNSCFDGLVGYGGLGLKCVNPDCLNVILLSEFDRYIDEEDFLPLHNRLQEQCVIDAGLADLVTCAECSLKSCVDIADTFFICNCGRKQCRSCTRSYDTNHEGKTCQQLDSQQALESKMSDIIIRNCHQCNIAFVKNGGCNKMSCTRCGATQCYVCREPNITYNHFCNCNLDELAHGKCEICGKGCRNTEVPEELDEIAIRELQIQFND